jgi:TolB-like protein
LLTFLRLQVVSSYCVIIKTLIHLARGSRDVFNGHGSGREYKAMEVVMYSYRVHHTTYHHLVLSIILVVSLSFLVTAQSKRVPPQKLNIAVMDFDAREGLTRGEAASLSDLFSSQMVATGEFTVIDRNRIKLILQEQGFQQSDVCSQVECIVEAGRILKVQKMFAGTIGKIGKLFNVNIQMIDIATSQIELNKNRQYNGDIEVLAEEVIPELAKQMAEQVTGKQIEKADVGKASSSKWLWYVGGAAVVAGGAAYYFLAPKNNSSTSATNDKLPGPPGLP